MQNNAKIGGILSIISGAFGVLWLFWAVFGILMFNYAFRFSGPYMYDMPGFPDDMMFTFVSVVYGAWGVFFALVGVLGIVGGVFALKKKYWGLALAGAIAGTVVFFPCGIPAIIYTAMAKPEFQSSPPAEPAASSTSLPQP